MTKFNSENPDPRNRFNFEEEGLNLDDMLQFIEEIKKHGFKASNPKAQEILKKFPHKLQEYLIEIEKIKKDKEKENPNETPEEKEKRKKENSERSNKIAQELFIIACASEMPMDKALQFHENCRFGVKELSQFGENGLSPLSAMMLSDKSPEEMQKVIDKGADINEKSPSGMTVTDLAVLVGNEKMVETLEQKGGKLNLVSKERGREKEVEEEREKGREKSREREQEKQQRQIQKKQEAAQRDQAARELKQQMSEERIQQQQIARQMQMVIVREAMEVHEELRAELLKKKQELQKIKEEPDAKLREQEEQLKVQNAETFKEQQFKNEEKKIEKPPISELEKMLGTTLVDLNIDKLLFDAVKNGQQTMALLLVRFGGNVNHRENGISVLDAAVANGNNSLIATLFTFSSPDTIKKALTVVDASPQAQKLLENLVHKQEKIEQKILPDTLRSEFLPEVSERKIETAKIILEPQQKIADEAKSEKTESKVVNNEGVTGKLPLPQVEEKVVNLNEFKIVGPVIKTEEVLSNKPEQHLQDEVKFPKQISSELNQLESKFDATIEKDEASSRKENHKKNEEGQKNSEIIEKDLGKKIPTQTFQKSEIKKASQATVLNPHSENAMIPKSPIPKKQLPTLEEKDSKTGDKKSEINPALESQIISYNLEELKKDKKQKDESELPLPTTQVQDKKFNDNIKPPKADLPTQDKDPKSKSQTDEDKFKLQFGSEKSENFKTEASEIIGILGKNAGQVIEKESEFTDKKPSSLNLGKTPSKSPIPVSATKTSITEKQAGIAMSA